MNMSYAGHVKQAREDPNADSRRQNINSKGRFIAEHQEIEN